MLAIKPIHNIIIFTDLDGTLLDHNTYDFSPALEIIEYCKINNIPIIITTSKTKSEVLQLQEQLKIDFPFIIENGAGIVIPTKDGLETIDLGITYDKTIEAFKKYQKNYNMEGFNSMSTQKVSELTNLPLEDASMAKQRSYGEPFLLLMLR